MSARRTFRGAVDGPRPYGALVMVLAAFATLDVTRQMAPWVMLIQLGALAWASARRELPLQRNAAALNLALTTIVGLTMAMWMRGVVAIVALAHFATLAQALQLIDARPRKSEFLLVTLALFQVVLASNLTDSVLFPPLLVVFLLATVWTLMVHTLQVEALEAGDPLAASRIATPGLLRNTLVASTLSILLALALFVVLPRMRSGVLRGQGVGLSLATSGFSDQIELGDLGRIRKDPSAVLHVETLSGTPAEPGAGYWRGLAFDHFDGRRWSVTPSDRRPLIGNPEFGMDLRQSESEPDLVQRIVREPVRAGVIFSRGRARRIRGALAALERDMAGGLYSPAQQDQRIVYTIATQLPARADRAQRALPPPLDADRHLQLPELAPWVSELAREITADADSDAARTAQVERWLRENGHYSDTPPTLGDQAPVEVFLGQGLAGHCEYFASAMVVLLRSIGLPARMVNGFAGGRRNALGGFVTLTRADAHAWVEVHFEGAGWVRFDPTPPDLRRAAAATGIGARLAEAASAVELWWFRRIVDFDRSDQALALRSAWLAWRSWKQPAEKAAPEPVTPRDETSLVDGRAVALALLAVAALIAAARLRHWQHSPRSRVPRAYASALRLLARRGMVRAPATAARTFALRVAGELPAPAGEAFGDLTESYLAVRFGGHPPRGEADDEALRRLRDSLRG